MDGPKVAGSGRIRADRTELYGMRRGRNSVELPGSSQSQARHGRTLPACRWGYRNIPNRWRCHRQPQAVPGRKVLSRDALSGHGRADRFEYGAAL